MTSAVASIPLRNGGFTVIDSTDLELASRRHWRARRDKDGRVTAVMCGKISLHRLLLGAKPGVIVDHRNGDPLDNRRDNLRVCTHAQNMRNRRIHRQNKSGFKGVCLDRRAARHRHRKIWRARIQADGVVHRLGRFATPEQAHRAYCDAATKLHGEFARTA